MDFVCQNLRLELARPNLNGLPEVQPPPGYVLRWFRPGDAAHWLRIHHDADPFNEITPVLFTREFGTDFKQLAHCQCYLQDAAGRVIGTGTAWSAPERPGGPWGRVFWLAIMRHCQGLGLSKPLLAAVCHRLRERGFDRACVVTSTGRLPAINLYLQFGFQPEIHSPTERETWDKVFARLKATGRLHETAAAA